MEGKRHHVPTSGVGEPFGALAPTTWFGVPTVPDDYVRRPRLFRLLDRGATSPLVMVSAPAGSGKTSLVADWMSLRASEEQTEWVTFEREDEAFWPGVLGGLTRLGVAAPSRSFPAGTMAVGRQLLTALAMVIARSVAPVTLVLDGYELESRNVANDLDYLLRHSGRRLKIVLVTRVDPILPLYRYRLEDSLTEIRMADLAFNDTEAEELLSRAGVTLTAASIHALNERTHGWVAGLRFASKFLRKSENPDMAVGQVAGDSGDIGEYLMGEVLAGQTPENRHLLLSTSIPATLQPGLAEALGGRGATRMLSVLARDNTFVEPVPEHPGFYRYHPFFRDLLRAELAYESPEEMIRLQRTAAEWFAHEGLFAASVSHYAEIGAWAEAAGLVVDESALAPLVSGGTDAALAKVLMQMPQELRDPAASVVRAALALGQGDPERVTTELAQVPDTERFAGDGRSGALSLAVAVLQSIRARASDDPQEAFELAGEAEEALTDRRRETRLEAQHELSALVFGSKGIAALRRGRLSQAHDLFTEGGAQSARGLGSAALLAECQGYLALIACLRDHLSEAVSLADRAVATADGAGIRVRDRSAAPHVALAWVAVERQDLSAAARHVKSATMSDAFLGDRVPVAMLALAQSRMHTARGDVNGAISILNQAAEDIGDATGWVAAQLRFDALHLKLGKNDVAGVDAEARGLEQHDPAAAALILAQVGLVEGDDNAVREALAGVIGHDSRPGMQMAAWLVEATRQLRNGSLGKARAAVDRAVRLGAAEGFRRPFREASPDVSKLLADDTALARVGTLASLSLNSVVGAVTPGVVVSAPRDHGTIVVERLTEKELEVLGHLAELLSTEEIADAMFVSVNTIRTHVRNILRKLGVPRRNAAVRRARELDLLPL
jgi:LuxR family transcriptional regulator, maltose regulon positive regulatory protein